MERPPRPGAFPRWRSPVARPEPVAVPGPRPAPGNGSAPQDGFATLRHQGWTVWFGRHTGQYWAAHTGRMRLLCADSPEELVGAVTALATTTTARTAFAPVPRGAAEIRPVFTDDHGKGPTPC